MLERQAASSIAGLVSLVDEFLRTGRFSPCDPELVEERIAVLTPAEKSQLRDIARRIREVAAGITHDSKLQAFLNLLEELRRSGTKRVLVFSFFRHTLAYLREQLSKKGVACALIWGDTPHEERPSIIDEFEAGKFEVLLSSEVAAEGLDLQFCDCLVNYDLPWNPMRIEQRIGRLDRYGQKHDVVRVYNLVLSGTIEDRILYRCLQRIGVFEHTIGGLEPIIGEIMEELRRDRVHTVYD